MYASSSPTAIQRLKLLDTTECFWGVAGGGGGAKGKKKKHQRFVHNFKEKSLPIQKKTL